MKLPQAGGTRRDWFGAQLSVFFALLAIIGGVAPGPALGTIIDGVEMQPGEWTKTIPGVPVPTGQTLEVRVSVPALVCNVDVSRIRAGVMAAAKDGSLTTRLTYMEANPTSSSGSANAIRWFSPTSGASGRPVLGREASSPLRFTADNGSVNAAWSAGQPVTLRPIDLTYGQVRDCLSLSDAQALVFRLREVIRKYLGMPPPSVPLQSLPPPGVRLPPG